MMTENKTRKPETEDTGDIQEFREQIVPQTLPYGETGESSPVPDGARPQAGNTRAARRKERKKNFGLDPDSPEGILSQIREFAGTSQDEEQIKRLQRTARINAFGDLVKHLGAFAGGGYAPVEKRTENQGMLRALQKADRIRELQGARKGRSGGEPDKWLEKARPSDVPGMPETLAGDAGAPPPPGEEAPGRHGEQAESGAISRFYPDGTVGLAPEIIAGIEEIDGNEGDDNEKLLSVIRFLKERGAGKDEIKKIVKTFQL